MSKHNAGPWTVSTTDFNCGLASAGMVASIIDAEGYYLAEVWGDVRDDDGSAIAAISNAKLMAVAPELLDACVEFVRKVENGEARSKRSYAQMKAAIAKVSND